MNELYTFSVNRHNSGLTSLVGDDVRLSGGRGGAGLVPAGPRTSDRRIFASKGLPLDVAAYTASVGRAEVLRRGTGGAFNALDVQAAQVAIKRWGAFGSPSKFGKVAEVVTSSGTRLWEWSEGDWRPAKPSWLAASSLSPRASRGGLVDSAITDRCTSTVAVYRRDVRVSRVVPKQKPTGAGCSTRGRITHFSVKSQNNLRFVARNLEPLTVLLTLTYPDQFPCDGAVVKRDWAAMRKWLARRNLGGLQALEFHERGAPHIHAYLNGRVDKGEVAAAWYRIVGSGDIKHLKAGTRIEKLRKVNAMSMYVVKYISKEKQKRVPEGFENVGRFWSLFGGVRLTPNSVLSGERAAVAPLIRIVRGLVNGRRSKLGVRKKMHDRGGRGWQAWEIAPAIMGYLERAGIGPEHSMALKPPVRKKLKRNLCLEAEDYRRQLGVHLAWGVNVDAFSAAAAY